MILLRSQICDGFTSERRENYDQSETIFLKDGFKISLYTLYCSVVKGNTILLLFGKYVKITY